MNEKENTYTTRISEGTFQRVPCLACMRHFRPNIVRVELMAGDKYLGAICPQCLEAGSSHMLYRLALQQEYLKSLDHAVRLCADWVTPGELAEAEKKIDKHFQEENESYEPKVKIDLGADLDEIPF